MSPLKTIIADAVSRYPLETSPEWAGVRSGAAGDAEIERIEADGATIHTVDCLFDGEATVYLTDMDTKQEMDDVWCDWIGEHGPCRACVGTELAHGHRVEIKVLALKG